MPYQLFVNGNNREFHDTQFGRTNEEHFTVKVGTKSREFDTLADVIGFLNTEFGFTKKKFIPSDAELRWVEDKQTDLFRKSTAAERSAAAAERSAATLPKATLPKAALVDSKSKPESSRPKTMDEMRNEVLGPLWLKNLNPKNMEMKRILSALLRGGYVLTTDVNGKLTSADLPTFDIYGYHSYNFKVYDSRPLKLKKVELGFSGWIHYSSYKPSIYISDQPDNINFSHFYDVREMNTSIEEFVLKKVKELMETK